MKDVQPPKWAQKLLLGFLKEELAEEVLGDLDEKFYAVLSSHSTRKAKLNYWFQVFNYFRPFALKHYRSDPIPFSMLKQNFLISYRILLKNKVFSTVNIGGLAIGMTVVFLIGLWIHDEFSFNTRHEHYDRIVQVMRKDFVEGDIRVNSSLVGQAGIYLADNFPHLFDKVAMTFFRSRSQLLTVDRHSYDQDGYFFQPDGPELLSLNMLAGTREGLKDISSILISESLAKKFFGHESPMGQSIQLNSATELTVRGVFEDLPLNSTFGNATFFASMEIIYNEQNPYTWDNYNMKIYALLKPAVKLADASEAIKEVLIANRESSNRRVELFLHPMKDWHLRSEFENGIPVPGQRFQFVKLYGIIGFFVLLLACINFINLNTARYQNRAKEIGVRKTLGSQRSYLIAQFLAESMLYAFGAFCISILAVHLALPWFNGMSDKAIQFPWYQPWFWFATLAFTLFTALLAGLYPALFLSGFSPIKALNGKINQGKGNVRFRQGLVVFQFTISIILIIGTITIHQLIQNAKDRPVGYEQDRLITVRGLSQDYFEKYDLLREELKKTGVVTEMAEANYPLINTLGNNGGFSLPGASQTFDISFNTIYVTPEYGQTTQWELTAGRDFSRELGDESGSIILSESAVQQMGLDNPIGQQIQSRSSFNGRDQFTIVGVVKDMIKGSPFESAMPLMVFPTKESLRFLFIRIQPEIVFAEALPKIQEAFEGVLPDNPFHYQFVDEEYNTKFRSEERIGSIATLFSFLAILISCLGLFGLSAYMAEKRSKEIGIRKVLGASVMNVWLLLSRDFSLLVVIASLIAVPIAAYFLNGWLQSYEYRIPVFWWIYLIGGIASFVVTILTVSYHALKVSLANPVESLRME